jgi:hypothetical protein
MVSCRSERRMPLEGCPVHKSRTNSLLSFAQRFTFHLSTLKHKFHQNTFPSHLTGAAPLQVVALFLFKKITTACSKTHTELISAC